MGAGGLAMRKLVVLKLDGDLSQGVRVTFEIGEEGERPSIEISGYLPKATDLVTANHHWQSTYQSLGNLTRIKAQKITYGGSITEWGDDCHNWATQLSQCLNNWLVSESFRPIREKWLQQLSPSDEVRVLIRTSSVALRKLPWHLWDLVEDYPKAEVAYCAPESEQSTGGNTPAYRDKVRILAILGDSTGINLHKDRQLLENLPDAAVTFLVEPQRQDINDQLWNQHWDILFFAGHSQTEGETGRIYINQTDSLTIAELRYGLRNAVANGLQLAIFNSCDGLGLALELEQLHIGQMIVMREPVPDEVAQAFLTYFLAAFADGKSFYLAEREARLKLQGLEDNFPCASWLPAIFQNPAAVPPFWQDLGRRPTEVCPYRGLFAFREEDAPFFYGREAFTEILVEAVQKQPLVAVIGSSGSGKSSVAFAGLIPRLRQEGKWRIVSFRPGDRPLHALAGALISQLEPPMSRTNRLREVRNLAADLRSQDNALRDVVDDIVWEDSDTRLLLVADQFEELYTLCRDAQERQVFLDRLLQAANSSLKFTLVLTLRADFLGQALSYRPFADALQYADLKLGPMNREELQAAVEQPATMLGVTIESGLTQRILEAVSAEPGDLPLLEFALNQLWAKQRDAQLTHAAYEEIGGVEAALARYAEEAYGRLNEEEKERARRIFIQLVRPGEGTEDTRRLATRTEVGEENWDLVTRLASARLVVSSRDEATGEETVEIVHEALIGGWERLRLWIELDRSFRTWQERLRASLRQWQTTGRDEGALLRGAPLAEAEGWLLSRPVELNSPERSFIEQSRAVRSRQRQRLVFGLSLGLVGALSLAGMAGLQWQRAEYQRQGALGSQLAFQAESLQNQQDKLLRRNVLLAIEAMQRFPSPVAEQVLRESVGLLPRPVAKLASEGCAMAFSPDGKYLVVSTTKDDTLLLWSVSSGREVARLKTVVTHVCGDNAFSYSGTLAFSSDGKYLATVGKDGLDDTARIWELSSVREVMRLKHQGTRKVYCNSNGQNCFTHEYMRRVAFSPDSKYLTTVGSDGTARVWSVSNGREFLHLRQRGVLDIAFSPDSKYLATAGNDGMARVWDATNGRELMHLRHTGKVVKPPAESDFRDTLRVTFTLNGKYLVTTDSNGTNRMWEVTSGREVVDLKHKSEVVNLAFSPGEKYLAMASRDADGTVRVLEATSGREVARVKLGSGQEYPIAVSPDGKYIVTNTSESVRVWETTSGREVVRVIGAGQNAIISANGKFLVTAGHNSPVRVWEVTSGYEVARKMTHKDSVKAIVFSSDGKYLATTSEDKTAWVWSATSGHDVVHLKHEDSVESIAYSRDGKYLTTASWDGTARVWETISCREITRIITEEAATLSTLKKFRQELGSNSEYGFTYKNTLAFSPDGKYLVKVGLDRTVRIWETSSAREVMRLKNDAPHIVKLNKLDPPNLSAVTFSPDGRYLATITNGYLKTKEPSSDSKEASSVRVWEVNSGREVAHMNYDSSHVKTISFSPDGTYLAMATSNNIYDNPESNVSLWETVSGRKIAYMQSIGDAEYLAGNPSSVKVITFSPDGRYLAGIGGVSDKTIWVWEATSGRGVAFLSHDDTVNTIAFSPDGKYLSTASKDKTARVWPIPSSSGREITRTHTVDIENSQTTKTLRVRRTLGVGEAVEVARITHEDNIVAVAFSPDGKYLATASDDKTAQVQLWRREDLMAEACTRLTRNLAEYEWKLYLPGEPYHKTCPNLPVPEFNDVPELR
jgi:WD40 repeat protein